MAQKVFKNPIEQAQKLTQPKYTLDNARNHIRAILGQDPNNSILESYDDYLMRKGLPSLYKQQGNGPWTYPKGVYKTILSDDDFLVNDVLPYLDNDNYYGDKETSDDVIESNLARMGYRFR